MFIITIAVATFSLTALSYSGSGPLGLNLNVGIILPEKNVEKPIYIDTVDWRKAGAVTPVKNQKQCNSSWAFASTGALEAQHFRKTGQLVSLSEQNLIDCSKESHGCDEVAGMDSAFEYVKQNGGIDTEKFYPYEAKKGQSRYNSSYIGATCRGHRHIPSGDEKALQAAVRNIGPIAVAIDSSRPSFRSYSDGIYYDPGCTQQLDHKVLVVGYGVDSETGDEYYLVKNSWGEEWGQEGYIKMARNKNNMCGIASKASYPIV